MIKYNLTCKKCNLIFDSWFASSMEYEKLKKKKLINCYNCNSLKVEKSLMAPKLIKKQLSKYKEKEIQKYKNMEKVIKEYQKIIKNNFEYVGKNFAYEARSIHYKNKKKKNKGVYGIASQNEIKELNEEGIETQTIPWIQDKNN